MYKIPLARPDLRGNEEAFVVEAIRSSWISSSGPYIQRFEEEFAGLCDTRHCLGVSNGTVALHLALLGLDLRPGDEVIVPSLTFIATANAVRYLQGEPVFVDVDPDTWCLSPEKIEEKITRRTKGIIAVHLYGHPADMDAINHLAAVHGLWVLEDAAEAHLATYKGRPTGGLAKIGTYSFYGNKIFTCGEGGALTLNDSQLELRLRSLRGQGMDPQRRYYFPISGYNFRITNLACALLCAQLERSTELINARKQIFKDYREALEGIDGIEFQPVASWADPAPWLFSITVNEKAYGRSRDELAQYLEEAGIETRPFFIALHTLPPFREEAKLRKTILPVTDKLSKCGMNLPTFTSMTKSDIEQVAQCIRQGKK